MNASAMTLFQLIDIVYLYTQVLKTIKIIYWVRFGLLGGQRLEEVYSGVAWDRYSMVADSKSFEA